MKHSHQDNLRIVVDGRFLENAETQQLYRTGVFYATVGLLRALQERQEVDLHVIGCSKCSTHFIRQVLRLPEYIFEPLVPQRRPTVFLSTFLDIDEGIQSNPFVVPYLLVYDLWAHALNMNGTAAFNFEEKLARSISPRTVVATISQATRNDLCRHYHVPHDQVSVTYLGVRPDWSGPIDTSEYPQIEGLPKGAPYILCLSTLEPRKNLLTSLKAFERLTKLEDQAHRADNNRTFLVVVGADGWGNQAELFATMSADARSRTIVAGYLPDSALQSVIQHAVCLMHPALYEGFGLPVLEAQHLGTPVITSNRGALQEIAGAAGIILDAMDFEGYATAAFRLLNDAALRDDMSNRGKIQSANFNYQRCSQSLLSHPFLKTQINNLLRIL
jgi:glycosyltransferase involved in cell wall biosynthesis